MMTRFSVSDVAMTGFGVVAKRPAVLIWWIVLHLVFILAVSALTVTIAGPAMTQMAALQAQPISAYPQLQAQNLALFQQIAPLYLLMLPVTLVFYAVLFAAMNRAVLRPERSAFGYLRLGADEWRQFLLFLWAVVVAFGAYIALLLVSVIVILGAAALLTAMHKSGGDLVGGQGMATLGVIAFALVCVAAYIYVLVRLSLASAMTFDTGRG